MRGFSPCQAGGRGVLAIGFSPFGVAAVRGCGSPQFFFLWKILETGLTYCGIYCTIQDVPKRNRTIERANERKVQEMKYDWKKVRFEKVITDRVTPFSYENPQDLLNKVRNYCGRKNPFLFECMPYYIINECHFEDLDLAYFSAQSLSYIPELIGSAWGVENEKSKARSRTIRIEDIKGYELVDVWYYKKRIGRYLNILA